MYSVNWKRIVGIALMVLAVALLVFAIVSYADGLAKEGPIAGNYNSYKPAYESQPILIIASGIASVVSFLAGISLVAFSSRRR